MSGTARPFCAAQVRPNISERHLIVLHRGAIVHYMASMSGSSSALEAGKQTRGTTHDAKSNWPATTRRNLCHGHSRDCKPFPEAL